MFARITSGLAPGTEVDPPESGRCIRFDGQQRLTGKHRLADLVRDTGIDGVVAIGATLDLDTVIDTGGFVRPEYRDGDLVLLVERAAGGVFQPVEVEQPHECCAGSH